MSDKTLPKDYYSTRLRELQANPGAIEKTSLVDAIDFYGNAESWVVKTIRVDGTDTVFVQRNNADGGSRWVLPPDVTSTISRQRDSVVAVSNRQRARSAAATRKAKRAQGGAR